MRVSRASVGLTTGAPPYLGRIRTYEGLFVRIRMCLRIPSRSVRSTGETKATLSCKNTFDSRSRRAGRVAGRVPDGGCGRASSLDTGARGRNCCLRLPCPNCYHDF